jgi:hypothetical protein
VISNQTFVLCFKYSNVSSTAPRWPVHSRFVELLGERLEVDIGGVHEGIKLLRGVDVAGCDRHVLDSAPASVRSFSIVVCATRTFLGITLQKLDGDCH